MVRIDIPRDETSVIDFSKNGGLVPAIVLDAITRKVLMLGYVNREALKLTLETGYAHFYSRSRRRIWMKGETSGNKLRIVRVEYDCDSDTVLYYAIPSGPTCHTGKYSCFHNILKDNLLEALWKAVIEEMKKSRIVRRPGAGGLAEYVYVVNPLTDNIPPPSPLTMSLIADYLSSKIPEDIDKTVTIEVLGLPIASLVAERVGKPLAIVRERPFPAEGWREPFQSGYKSGVHYVYGVNPGEKVVLIDDAVSTGGAAESVVRALEKHGVKVEALLVSLAKPQYGGVERLKSMGVQVYRPVDLYIEGAQTIKLIQPDTGWSIELTVEDNGRVDY